MWVIYSLCFVIIFSEKILGSFGWLLFFMWVVGFLFALNLRWWRCPSCDKAYFEKGFGFFGYNPWATECRYCGLPKWEEPPAKEAFAPSLPPSHIAPDPMIAIRQKRRTFLTLVLRDDPGVIGLKLDQDGWVDIGDLLKRAKRNKIALEREDLDLFSANEEGGFLEIEGFKNLMRYVER